MIRTVLLGKEIMNKNIFITLSVLILTTGVFIWFGMKHTTQAFSPYPHDSRELGL